MQAGISEKEAYVAFNLAERVGFATVSELAAKHGSVAAAWEAYPDKTSRAGGVVDAKAEFAKAKKWGVEILTPADAAYPAQLASAPGRPLALYVKGDPAALSKPSIAIIGTRRATQYGLDQAAKLAAGLAANGWAVVSGLALGIDAEAHRGALSAKGVTVGVLGGGLDEFYPRENRDLAREMVAAGGAVVSEFPFGRKPDQQSFPQRNHVVAALVKGVVAVEAPIKSGTLITTGFAADLGRVVMAVPGRVDSMASAGCLGLIRDGARLVRSVRDIEEEMGELFPMSMRGGLARREESEAPAAPEPRFSVEESMVMRHVDADGIRLDALVEKTGLSAAKVNSVCMSLRIKGRVRFFPGNRVALPRSE
jgi:DNA processing protein